jgi:nucleotide-binding universal stress UspA family protein
MITDTGHPERTSTPQEDRADHAASEPNRAALVVGHDGHPASAAALATAIDLATRLEAHLHVIHSVTLDDYGIDPDIEEFEEQCDRNLARERQSIADALTAAAIRWTYHEERGDPARQLATLAANVNASFIIVGASQSGIVCHLIGGGAVPKRLLHLQARPVLIVPPGTAHH